jgi:hypothetical protein
MNSPPRTRPESKSNPEDDKHYSVSPVQNARVANAEPFKLEELRISAPQLRLEACDSLKFFE